MKINNVNASGLEHLARSEAGEADGARSPELVFKSHLSNESESAYLVRIEGLITEIEKQGVRLGKRADMAEMQKYREMITKLLNETVSNGFAFEKEGKMGFNGRSKIFVVIKKINTKLDEMTRKVLEGEKDHIDLLDDIDDIRGLLVDMYF
jgi:uncharacterized protein YaaR (DUF327 family)